MNLNFTPAQQRVIVNIKTYIYGKQIQSDQTNVAVSAFIFQQLFNDAPLQDFNIEYFVKTAIDFTHQENLSPNQRIALALIFGDEVFKALREGSHFRVSTNPHTGALTYKPSKDSTDTQISSDPMPQVPSEDVQETISKLNKFLVPSMVSEFGERTDIAALYVAYHVYSKKGD